MNLPNDPKQALQFMKTQVQEWSEKSILAKKDFDTFICELSNKLFVESTIPLDKQQVILKVSTMWEVFNFAREVLLTQTAITEVTLGILDWVEHNSIVIGKGDTVN